MELTDRPRRSLLYVPASGEAMVRKAGARGADVVIVDLEDGVHPDAKATARDRIAGYLRDVDFGGAEAAVRVNAAGTPWLEDDLSALRGLSPASCVLPKCEDPAAVAAADQALGERLPLLLMVETALGVARALDLARATPRVAGLVFGGADFRESVRATRTPDESELAYARGALVVAARAAGVLAFDTPWFDYRDERGLRASGARVRALGFDGKTAIHPAQVGPINELFAPTPAEIEKARQVIEALDEAAATGRAVATVDGEMVEALHARGARRVLAHARRLEL
jgi:citrate lyase subunit beta/citryl-CoA lyase